MSEHSAFLIPIVNEEFDKNIKFQILRDQIESSIDLISNNTAVVTERSKLKKVWDSFLDNIVAEFGAEAIELDDSEFATFLKWFSAQEPDLRVPWMEKDQLKQVLKTDLSRFNNHVFAIVSRHSSKLDLILERKDSLQARAVNTALVKPEFVGDPVALLKWCITNAQSFPTVIFGHQQITRAVFDYLSNAQNPFPDGHWLCFSYKDGSVGSLIDMTPFPKKSKPTRYLTELNLGLITNRHYKLDENIDLYLLRNTEIGILGKNYSSAEQEQLAYKKGMKLLQQLRQKNSVLINIYPSGLEPANIGLIRAIIENVRMKKSRPFEARIYEYRDKKYETYLSFK